MPICAACAQLPRPEASDAPEKIIAGTKAPAKELEKIIKGLVQEDKNLSRNAQRLQTILAIDWMPAVYLLSRLGDGSRFKNGKATAIYMGLAPVMKPSGGSLRWLAANSKVADEVIVALMRKLVTTAQSVLKYQRPFNSTVFMGKAG